MVGSMLLNFMLLVVVYFLFMLLLTCFTVPVCDHVCMSWTMIWSFLGFVNLNFVYRVQQHAPLNNTNGSAPTHSNAQIIFLSLTTGANSSGVGRR